jgi:hypothetical protein
MFMKNVFKGIILLMILTFVFAGCSVPLELTEDTAEGVSKSIAVEMYYGTVIAVDPCGNSILVRSYGGGGHIKHAVTSRTKIYLNRRLVSLKKLKPGDRAKVYYVPTEWKEALHIYAAR